MPVLLPAFFMEKTCVYLSSSILTPALTMPSPLPPRFVPELDLQLMTTVAGNVSVEKTTRNALQLLHFWNAEIPLAQGAAVPLVRAPRDAASVHGESGMAGYDFVEHNRKPLGIPAFLAIRDALMRAPEPVTLVAIGPLTNIALLLSQCPECKPYIRRLVIMVVLPDAATVRQTPSLILLPIQKLLPCFAVVLKSSCAVWMSPIRQI